jgi:hypothetical protein
METASSSKMLVSTYKTTWCHNPEHHTLNSHYCKNIKSHISVKLKYSRIFIIVSEMSESYLKISVCTAWLSNVKIFLLDFTGNCSWQNGFNN